MRNALYFFQATPGGRNVIEKFIKSDLKNLRATNRSNTLEGLLENHPVLAKRARDRAGLAEIASLLLQLRHELKLSQKDLASRSGLSKTMISELENSANDGVTLRTLVKIARGAGASLSLKFDLTSKSAGCVKADLHTGSHSGSMLVAEMDGPIKTPDTKVAIVEPFRIEERKRKTRSKKALR